ncbi:SDR family NAD(P)-dependent oxidoreductase [Nonomuraea jiangxiensis]|uniref:3-oxoacyl-[acyl-carrier protein] reductase n=1 Tax=Nonomuraea jiangxiensis TaxID=633440 RepID=A0A1G8KK37_9ACTN|nr:SDR family NAD(P)-dependent oxidoreductase [Nonomuraea jiangxiensis]SDI43764.1 3-oxoacyl-[acyl-carrier protein] reductase [Nonomuraea jiangxiensis]
MTDLDGRVALLTGASGGIGRALGRRLIAAGVRTAFAYGSRARQADELVAESRAAGVDAAAFPGDLADPQVPMALLGATAEALGPVDLLIANAGHAVQLDYTDVDAATWERTMAVNLRAPFLLAQRALPGMVERGFGRVLFMSSVAGFTGGIVGPHYAASKAGLHGLVHYLAARVARRGVTVNALAPALIEDTGMLPATASPDNLPVGRYGRPEEVADLAMAVLGNGFVTSQVMGVDGGAHPR